MKPKYLVSALFVMSALQLFCCSANKNRKIAYIGNCSDSTYYSISVAKLVRHSEHFANRLVQVEGIYRLRFELSALFPNKWTMKKSKAIWLDFPLNDDLRNTQSGIELTASQEELNNIINRKVIMKGRCIHGQGGHMSEFPGTLSEICFVAIVK